MQAALNLPLQQKEELAWLFRPSFRKKWRSASIGLKNGRQRQTKQLCSPVFTGLRHDIDPCSFQFLSSAGKG